MPNFFQKLFRRNKEVDDEALVNHHEQSDKRERKKKSKNPFQRDKKPSLDNDGFGRHVETSSSSSNPMMKKSPSSNNISSNDAASKRKRGNKQVSDQPSPSRLVNSYHDHPFAASSNNNNIHRTDDDNTAKKSSSSTSNLTEGKRQQPFAGATDRRDTENTKAFASSSSNIYTTNFADFNNRDNNKVTTKQDKITANSHINKANTSSSSTLSYQTLQQYDQQWKQSSSSSSPSIHVKSSSSIDLHDPSQTKGPASSTTTSYSTKQVQLQRLPNGQLIIQPPPTTPSYHTQGSTYNNKKRSTHVQAPPPPPPMSPARIAALSPSAQSDFCLSTDVDDDEYNRLRKEAARNLSPMLDKATMSDDEEGYSDEDDFYKVVTKDKYHSASYNTLTYGKTGEKSQQVYGGTTRKNVGSMGYPQDLSYPNAQNKSSGRSSQYVSDSENERDLFSPKNNLNNNNTPHTLTYGGRVGPQPQQQQQQQQNVRLNQGHHAYRNPSVVSGGATTNNNNNDYFSDSENEVESNNQQASRYVFDSGFDDALVSNNTGHTQDGNRPHSPPNGPERIRSKQQQQNYPMLQSSSREKLSPSKMGTTTLQQQSLPKRQGLNKTEAPASSMYPDSSDSEDVILAQMQGHLSISSKFPVSETRTYGAQAKSHAVGIGSASVQQPSAQEQYFSRNKGMERNAVENFSPFENPRYESNYNNRSSKSLADQSPVLDLIAQAKADRQKRLDSSSVGAAPTLTAKYLQEHHNSKSASNHGTSRQETSQGTRTKTNNDMKALDKLSAKMSEDKSDSDSIDGNSDKNDAWLFDEVAGALGPRGIAADLESLGGKSNRSRHSIRSHKSKTGTGAPKRGHGLPSDEQSVGSKHSRTSRYSAKSSRSHFSHMSEQSRSVANDLIRLEMQLAMVGSNGIAEIKKLRSNGSVAGENKSILSSQSSRKSIPNGALKALKKTIIAPPGKLGIILANRTDSKGTVVSGVRTSSPLFEKVLPGDRLVEIDGEDVSMMSVSEITSIMARKNDFERELTIISLPNTT